MRLIRVGGLVLASFALVQAASLTVNFDFAEPIPPSENVENEGVQEATINDYDASYMEYGIQPTNAEAVQPKALVPFLPKALTSLEYTYSENFKVINIPIGYKLKDWLLFKARIPYVQRTIKVDGKSYSASGIGDVYVGFDIVEVREENFATNTTVATSLPTGDNEKTDNGVLVPLGKGAYNLHLGQSIAWVVSNFSFSVFGGVKVFLTDNEFTYQGQKYEEDIGTKYYLNFNINSSLRNLARLGAKLVYLQNAESRIRVNNSEAGLRNDLKVADLILYAIPLKLQHRGFGAHISVVIPVYTDYNDEVESKPDRKMTLSVRLTKLF